MMDDDTYDHVYESEADRRVRMEAVRRVNAIRQGYMFQ
jgi:hypothetical protein